MILKESQHIELKESWRDEYLKTISAFANTEGGSLFIGVDDNSRIIGIEKSKKLLEDLPNKILNTLGIIVGIELIEKEDKELLQIHVPKCDYPVSYQSRFYIRSGSTTQEIKGIELQRLLLKSNNLTWDEITVPRATIKDIDESVVRSFMKRAIDYNRLPSNVETDDMLLLLGNLGLINKQGGITRAAILLFGKNPMQFIHSAIFKIGRFAGENAASLIIHDLIEGNIFQMPDKVMDFLKSKYLLSPISYKELQRIETLEIPEKALREAILNAIIHRDYSSTSSIELRVFDNKLTLWNHGILEAPLTIEMLKMAHSSYPRNPLIANIFYRAGYIESWGRGTLTIIDETTQAGLPEPQFSNFSGGIQVAFERNQLSAIKVEPVNHNSELNSRQQMAVEYVKRYGEINNTIYQRITGAIARTATRDLKKLVDLKVFVVEKVGRNVVYTIPEKQRT